MESCNRFVFFGGLFADVEYGSSCWACVGKDVEVEVVLAFGILVALFGEVGSCETYDCFVVLEALSGMLNKNV